VAPFYLSPRTGADFLAAHEGGLGIKDYEAMLDHELAGKKHKSVIGGLQALIGEA
jgi:hypothetical protein